MCEGKPWVFTKSKPNDIQTAMMDNLSRISFHDNLGRSVVYPLSDNIAPPLRIIINKHIPKIVHIGGVIPQNYVFFLR